MRTSRGSSRRRRGGVPQCMLGYPQVWAWRFPPPRCGPGDPIPQVWAWRSHPPGVGLEIPPPGVGLETPSWPGPSTSPLGVGLETPPGDLQGMLGYHPPVDRILDTGYITSPQTSFAGGKNALYSKRSVVFGNI